MNFTEQKVSGERVYDGKILKLDVDKVKLADGRCSQREVIRHSGGAAVLLVDGDKILLVKQFRYAYGKEIYEIPAGKLNVGEDSAVSAARELEEETGYRAKLAHLADIYPTPGYTDEIIHIYLATEFERGAQKLDEGEFLSYGLIPIDKAVEMIDGGQICDAKTIVAVYKYLLMKK